MKGDKVYLLIYTYYETQKRKNLPGMALVKEDF